MFPYMILRGLWVNRYNGTDHILVESSIAFCV